MVQVKQSGTKTPTSYENVAYLFLSLYRFFAYVLAVLLLQVIQLDTAGEPGRRTYIILGLVGAYTLLKVFSPLLWQQSYKMTYVVLLFDIMVCTVVLMLTGGVDSAFLPYAVIPTITASLLFRERTAFIAAGLLSGSLFLAHLVLSQWSSEFAWIMEGNRLALLIVYMMFCFLIATLTYRTNLNIRQRIESVAVVDERMRIRRELHDGVAQALSYLNLRTKAVSDALSLQKTEQALSGLEDIQKVVKDTYEDIRQSIDSLSATRVLPLVPTLHEIVQEFGQRNNIEAEFHPPQETMKLSPMAELQMLRMVHESLNNARKHAQASNVCVKLDTGPKGVTMIIKDNGRGFPVEDQKRNSAGHHGLIILKERAESLGGTCDITSSPGQGTEIVISVPTEKVRI